MKITRDGVEYELTERELFEAHWEYERAEEEREKIESYNENIEGIKETFYEAVENNDDIDDIKIGSWYVELYDCDLDQVVATTSGDVHKGDTWDDFWDWLKDDIKEMDIDDYEFVVVSSVEYEGIDDLDVFAEDF